MTEQLDLITLTDPRSPAAEAYRTLRTNLTFAALDKPIETLLVTSPAPGEDKSTVLANLAVTMAQGERNVILVDADLRRPSLHEIFGVANERGLTTMVVEEAALDDPPLLDTGVDNLQLMPSGPLPPNPTDILGSRRMEEAIARLKTRADVVLFDAPPVVAVTDAAVLGTKVDGVLLVVCAGRTRREHTQRARELLERGHVRIVGAVLNNAPRDVALGGY
ncbi:MAG: capsular biosynthesis protein [Chloroflexi bacterium]|nr:MAG: capsular biosynthesis protein [Chloroflexota bacterium]RLC74657.1 MAG: capsular biosynthesis protein [Chloroflexota bacterium]HEY73778.1 CpsD/CapB family tyrosine-protein kinase [Thermoflexia bacterium]